MDWWPTNADIVRITAYDGEGNARPRIHPGSQQMRRLSVERSVRSTVARVLTNDHVDGRPVGKRAQ